MSEQPVFSGHKLNAAGKAILECALELAHAASLEQSGKLERQDANRMRLSVLNRYRSRLPDALYSQLVRDIISVEYNINKAGAEHGQSNEDQGE